MKEETRFVGVWVGEYGIYRVPEKFDGIKFRKDGFFDGRMAKATYEEFKRWVDEQEQASRVLG